MKKHVRGCVELCHFQIEHGLYFYDQNLKKANSWHSSEMAGLNSNDNCHVFDGDYCNYNVNQTRNPQSGIGVKGSEGIRGQMMICTNSREINELMEPHCQSRRRQVQCATGSEGETRNEAYSLMLLAGVVAECKNDGRIGDPMQIGAAKLGILFYL